MAGHELPPAKRRSRFCLLSRPPSPAPTGRRRKRSRPRTTPGSVATTRPRSPNTSGCSKRPAARRCSSRSRCRPASSTSSRELTTDGRNPRFSPDGRFIAYETGLEISRRTRIVPQRRRAQRRWPICPASRPRSRPPAAPWRTSKLADNPDLRRRRESGGRGAARRTEPRRAAAGAEVAGDARPRQSWSAISRPARRRSCRRRGCSRADLTYAADGRTLYFLGGREGQDDAERHLRHRRRRAPARVGDAAGLKGAPMVAASGDVVLYTVASREPVPQPQPPGRAGAAVGGGQARSAAVVRRRRSRDQQDDDDRGHRAQPCRATARRWPTSRARAASIT